MQMKRAVFLSATLKTQPLPTPSPAHLRLLVLAEGLVFDLRHVLHQHRHSAGVDLSGVGQPALQPGQQLLVGAGSPPRQLI